MLKKFLPLFCVCLFSACQYAGGDDLTAKPHSTGSRLDPNCDHYAIGGGSSTGCRPIGQGQPRDAQGQRLPL